VGFDRVGLEVNSSEGSIMSTVVIPNEIRAGQSLDPRPVMANFDELALFINDDVLTLDGSKAMTGHLTLSGPGVAGGHAVTKAQLDDAVGGDVAGGGFLPLAGGTLTGDGQILSLMNSGAAGQPHMGFYHGGIRRGYIGNANALTTELSAETNQLALGGAGVRVKHTGLDADTYLRVGGKDVSVDGHTHSQYSVDGHTHDVYTKKEIDDLLAARPLMKMCDKPTRVYDERNGKKALTWHKIQLPATIGGISRSGAKAAYLNITSVNAAYNSWVAVRPDGSNWNPEVDGKEFAALNVTAGEINNEHFLTTIGSNGAIEYWIHGDSPSDEAVVGIVLNVIALVF